SADAAHGGDPPGARAAGGAGRGHRPRGAARGPHRRLGRLPGRPAGGRRPAGLRTAVAQGAASVRQEVQEAFAPELAALEAADQRQLLDALAAVASWALWASLRTEAGHAPDEAPGAAG